MRILSVLLVTSIFVETRVAIGQGPGTGFRLAIRTGVMCHTGPDDQSPAAERYHVGDVINATKSQPGLGGAVWYFDAWRVKGISPSCWINARLTVPYDRNDREAAYRAIVDSMLARKDSVTFDEYVDVIDLLESAGPDPPRRGPGALDLKDTSLFARYPRLRYERLLMIERAIQGLSKFSVADRPLTRAWIAAHQDVLAFSVPGAVWEVPASAYWPIYDAHRTEDWAEPVAWTAAQHLPMGDECDADCWLYKLSEGPEQYWNRLPQGAHVTDALAFAVRLVRNALVAVEEGPPRRPTINSIRASLGQVNAPEKGQLLDLLQQLELKAK